MINGIEPKLMYLAPTQHAIGMPPLPTIGIVSISASNVKSTLSLTLINNCLRNNIIAHLQSRSIAGLTWIELIRLFESQNVVTKVYPKDKLHKLKMKDINSVIEHIFVFKTHVWNNLLANGIGIQNGEVVFTLMKVMLPSYRTFISSLSKKPNVEEKIISQRDVDRMGILP
jgi:hypothetical protein